MSKTPAIKVALTLPMLKALDAMMDGYEFYECTMEHNHLTQPCDGWSPFERRSAVAAGQRLDNAQRLLEQQVK